MKKKTEKKVIRKGSKCTCAKCGKEWITAWFASPELDDVIICNECKQKEEERR